MIEPGALASDSSPHRLLLAGYMVLLAGLDLVGTVLAKEWTVHRAPWQLGAGALAFVGLFAALVLGLRYAELSILTLGWIVVLQAAVLLVDRSRYGTQISVRGWVAITLIVVLQGVLVVEAGTGGGQPEPGGGPAGLGHTG
jgi:hypothetical protein